eukprot:jgi/Psemu1/295946/fgenesh1_pm.107_\
MTLLDYLEEPFVHHDDDCVKVMSIGASEDQTKFNNNSILMTEWRVTGYKPGDEIPPGAMYVASGFQQGSETPKSAEEFVRNDLKIEKLPLVNYPEGVDFHPHGIYIRKEDRTLYVINHAYEKGGERIDVFTIGTANDGDDDPENEIPNRLDYRYTITSDWMKNEMNGIFNSLIFVEKNKFYVTQYLAIQEIHDGWLSFKAKVTLERVKSLLYGKRATYVWYCEYDDESNASSSLDCRKAADNFIGANGITHNSDYSKVFVVDHKTITVFDRNPSSNELEGRTTVDIPHLADNVKFDDVSGNVYGGTINNLWSTVFKNHFPKESEDSTSGIVELVFEPESKKGASSIPWKPREVLSTSKLNGVSNGLRMNNFYVMGAGGFGYPGLLVCPVTEDTGKTNDVAGNTETPEL